MLAGFFIYQRGDHSLKARTNIPRLKHLQLDRPLLIFDCETTGTDPFIDKIVQLAIVRFERNEPQQKRTKPKSFVRLFNPERPIPIEASNVHGIRDEDVVNAGSFDEIAPWLRDQFAECDVGGFNVKRFDLPLVINAMRRAGVELDLSETRVLDAFEIFVRMQPRTLTAALWEYCGLKHDDAHDALGDVLATAAVLDKQIRRHDELPAASEEIDALFRQPDLMGRLEHRDGQLCFAFGKHRGQAVKDVARCDASYLHWILDADFLPDVKAAMRQAFVDAYAGSDSDDDTINED